MREIHIRPILNGFIVKVGCQELVFTDISVLAVELVRYQKNPEGVEKEYLEKSVNKKPLTTTLMEKCLTPLGLRAEKSGDTRVAFQRSDT